MASFEKQPNGTWKYRISYMEYGTRKTKTKSGFRTKKEAQVAVNELEQLLSKGISLTSGDELFSEYLKSWFEIYKKGKYGVHNDIKVSHAVKVASNFFEGVKLKDIDRKKYQKFINNFGQGRASSTVKTIHIHVKRSLLDAFNEGIIPKDPTYRITIKGTEEKKDERLKFLNEKEVKTLLTKLHGELSPEKTKENIILFALKTGCRISEVLGLTWDCVDFKNSTVSINKTWDYLYTKDFSKTKNKSSIRDIKIDGETARHLKTIRKWQKERQMKTGLRNTNNLVFINTRFSPPSPMSINETLKKICSKLKITGISLHGLRHTHASILLYQNLNIRYVSQRLGHGDITTTLKVYGHLIDEMEEQETEKAIQIMTDLHN